jgi:primosomal protein N' (replication factor Y)
MLEAKKFSSLFCVDVAVPVPVTPQGVLTYRVPDSLQARLLPGMRVLVPVGRRKITGIVTGNRTFPAPEEQEKLKDILDILDEVPVFPQDLLQLWQWAKDYYLTSPGEMLSAMLPGQLRSESTVVVKLKRQARSRVQEKSAAAVPELTPLEQELLTLVSEKKRVTTKTLRKHFPSLSLGRVLQKLTSLSLLEMSEHLQKRNSVSTSMTEACYQSGEEKPPFSLSSSQERAYRQILTALQSATFHVFLLHGVTGSGKTEVYLQATQATIASGKSVLILVPEIALTHQLIEQARQRFGPRVAVLHSGQLASERWQDWQRIVQDEATIVIGVRSAVFAPLKNIGLIVVDEEHDAAYKQEESVRYNARDLAVVRGKISSCAVILGSATPSLESYTHSHTRRYTLIELPERVEARPLPTVDIVDLRQKERSSSEDKIFSSVLRQALIENYHAGNQSLLFLNRRGYASYLQCRLCGEVLSCLQCSVSLTFHLQGRMLHCHYCGFTRKAPDFCPQCHESELVGGGIGTEQVEEALQRFLPQVRVARLDRDSVRQRGSLDRVLRSWHSRETDILIGTQMVTKGHNVPGVTLVGVLLADLSLNLPDFRSAERTFQLLTQVAGRAGRGKDPGRVIIQTYTPQHYSIRFAAHHDFVHFATYELRYRKKLAYPPFTRTVNIRFEGKDEKKVEACAVHLASLLSTSLQGDSNTPLILGPAPAPIERIKGRARWQLLLKGKDRHALHTLTQKARAAMRDQRKTQGVRIIVDVDPYSML